MKVIGRKQNYPILTPEEVQMFRDSAMNKEDFSGYDALEPQIEARLKRLNAILGLTWYDIALSMVHSIMLEVQMHYSFKTGLKRMLTIPRDIKEDEVETARFIAHTLGIFQAFGWIVEINKQGSIHILSFLPLYTVTPEDVAEEIRLRVEGVARHAAQIINLGLPQRQSDYSFEELGLIRDNDLSDVYNRIRTLFGQKWCISIINNDTIRIVPVRC